MELREKIAVVTGASSGLGKSISQALVSRNVLVYGLARNEQALESLRAHFGDKFVPAPIDISKQTEIITWIGQTFINGDGPDILINNAGVGSFHPIDEMSPAIWHQMVSTNLDGMFYLTSGLVPYMKDKPHATHIINIGSILGTVGRSQSAAYSTTKFGVQGFSQSLALELRTHSVKVTCLNPGSIETGFFKSSGIQSHDHMLQPDDIANTVIHLLETPDNYLISDLTIRPLIPKPPSDS